MEEWQEIDWSKGDIHIVQSKELELPEELKIEDIYYGSRTYVADPQKEVKETINKIIKYLKRREQNGRYKF